MVSEENIQEGVVVDTDAVAEVAAPVVHNPLDGVEIPALFGKYRFEEVVVKDMGLARYICLSPVTVPHTSGRHVLTRLGKANVSIVERLINNMMRTEDFTGKKMKSYKVVRGAFEILEKRGKKNPIQILVEAIEHTAPREEITRLRFGGINVPKAVDVSPSRRVDIALRNITRGAVQTTYKSLKPVSECLANEILLASRGDGASFAVSKKDESERVAASAR